MELKFILNKYKKKHYENYLILAKEGDIDYQMIIASILFDKGNIEECMTWVKKVAKQNNAQAQYLYGWYCLENHDLLNGKYYLSQASNQNYAKALYDEAKLMDFGDFGYEKNITKAISLYKQACNALYSISIETKGERTSKTIYKA